MTKYLNYLLLITIMAFFCQCGSSSTSNTNNDTTSQKNTVASSSEQEDSDSQDEGSSSSSSAPAEQKIKDIIKEYFALYAKRDWEALAGYYTPEITQFITLKNAKPAQVTASAKSFFKNKSNVRYTPDMATCKITQAQMGWNAEVALDIEWDQQKTRVLLKLAFVDPDYKIIFYKEEKVLNSQKEGEMSLEELYKSIPENLQLSGMSDMTKIDSDDPQVLIYSFGAVSRSFQTCTKLLNWQNRTILVMIHNAGGNTPSADNMTRLYSGTTSVHFLEKTSKGWSKPSLMSNAAQQEVEKFFKLDKVAPPDAPKVKFQGNDFTITQGNKKMSIAWDNGTYRIVSKEG
ncbi:hypothetical protein BKI52_03470 [marine bacterium AO1-C]|nr:hypothetical protein BKI52_03470 [marine bacterium AO1-C]